MSNLTAIQKVFAQVHSPSGFTFPQTVAALLALGVTRYHIDYTARTATAYKPNDGTDGNTQIETDVSAIPAPTVVPGTAWRQEGVVAAIRRIQSDKAMTYAQFAQECVDSGVVGYLAFLTGKQVLYYSADGDVHVEWFPGAGPQAQQ